MGIKRVTKSVKAILSAFENNDNAVSVVDLVDQLSNTMNKTTVYRILSRLEMEGVLHSFTDKDGLKWYAMCDGCSSEKHTDKHPHFQCNQCGKIECMPIEIQMPDVNRRNIESAEVLLLGQCEDCVA